MLEGFRSECHQFALLNSWLKSREGSAQKLKELTFPDRWVKNASTKMLAVQASNEQQGLAHNSCDPDPVLFGLRPSIVTWLNLNLPVCKTVSVVLSHKQELMEFGQLATLHAHHGRHCHANLLELYVACEIAQLPGMNLTKAGCYLSSMFLTDGMDEL